MYMAWANHYASFITMSLAKVEASDNGAFDRSYLCGVLLHYKPSPKAQLGTSLKMSRQVTWFAVRFLDY